MNSEKNLDALMKRAQDYQNREHEKNRKRIKNGFRSMLIVPIIFLILMFTADLTGTSKLIMLVGWIASMILIAVYLVVIEYADYKLMNMLETETAENENPENEQEEE